VNTPPGCVGETAKASMIGQWNKEAAAAYSQIITRYPLMDRGDDAKRRLAALHQPIPRPTKAAVAQNRAEEDSRREATTAERLMGVVKKGPDTTQASRVGEPTLVDPTPVAARDVVTTSMRLAMGAPAGGKGLLVETVKEGAAVPGPSDPAPRSDAPVAANGAPFAHTNTAAADPNELKPTTPDANELKPSGAPDPNELKPAADTQAAASADAAVAPPTQFNEIQPGTAAPGNGAVASSGAAPTANLASDEDVSSSKKKKKKGWKKIVTF
jgi:outer membrane protein assembly factor BamD